MERADFKFKPRSYLHFDLPLSEGAAWELVSDPSRVSSHSFYPFLGYQIKTKRIKREGARKTRSTKTREIKIAAHRDAAIYSYYSQLLSTLYENELLNRGVNKVPTAFRSSLGGKTNIEFAGEVFEFIEKHRPCVALVFDVKNFFDTLAHDYLKRRWMDTLKLNTLPPDHFAIFRSLTNFSWVNRNDAFGEMSISKNNPKALDRRRICTPSQFRDRIRGKGLIRPNPTFGKGIPQGSPISALLSNVYMIEFDSFVSNAVQQAGGLFRRYCDDIIVVVPLVMRDEIKKLVYERLEEAGVEANTDKAEFIAFGREGGTKSSKPLQYLGFTYDGADILMRSGALNRYYGKMRRGVSLAKQTQRRYNHVEAAAGLKLTGLRRRKLHSQYSYLIKRRSKRPKGMDRKAHGNFISYAYRASRVLGSPKIKRQVRGHWKMLQLEMRREIRNELRGP